MVTLDAWNSLDAERTKALVAYQRTLQANKAIANGAIKAP